jgi:hypothetical protein
MLKMKFREKWFSMSVFFVSLMLSNFVTNAQERAFFADSSVKPTLFNQVNIEYRGQSRAAGGYYLAGGQTGVVLNQKVKVGVFGLISVGTNFANETWRQSSRVTWTEGGVLGAVRFLRSSPVNFEIGAKSGVAIIKLSRQGEEDIQHTFVSLKPFALVNCNVVSSVRLSLGLDYCILFNRSKVPYKVSDFNTVGLNFGVNMEMFSFLPPAPKLRG